MKSVYIEVYIWEENQKLPEDNCSHVWHTAQIAYWVSEVSHQDCFKLLFDYLQMKCGKSFML